MALRWHQMKMKNQEFDVSRQAATLIKEWAQFIVSLQFYILW
jgi:hypothetical protein